MPQHRDPADHPELYPFVREVIDAYNAVCVFGDGAFAEDEAHSDAQRQRLSTALQSLVKAIADLGCEGAPIADRLRRRIPLVIDLDSVQEALLAMDALPDGPATYAAPEAPTAGSPGGPRALGRVCPSCGATTKLDKRFCADCGLQFENLTANDLLPILRDLQQQVLGLKAASHSNPELPETRLLSESFLERAFAVYGHALVAGLIVGIIPFVILLFILLSENYVLML